MTQPFYKYHMHRPKSRARLMRKLAIVERRIKTAGGKQLLMISLFDNVSVLHNKNNVAFLDVALSF